MGLVRRAPSGPKPSQVRESPVDQFIKKWPRRARRGEGLLRGTLGIKTSEKTHGAEQVPVGRERTQKMAPKVDNGAKRACTWQAPHAFASEPGR